MLVRSTLATATMLVALFGTAAPAHSSTACSKEAQLAGLCGASNTGTEIVVDGTKTTPGSRNVDNSGPRGPRGPSGPSGPPAPPPPDPFLECLKDWDSYIHCFEGPEDVEPSDDEPAEALPPVTISDLARFAPAGTAVVGEPDNLGVAGLPTNFVADTSEQQSSGTLFGYPVQVRFTPVGYDYAYGDGKTASITQAGRSWEDLGQAAFTPTPTSHTYTERGEYAVSVDVRYTAEVDLGIGWFTVPGEVTADGPTTTVRIFEAHTALVAHTCSQAPSSPGC